MNDQLQLQLLLTLIKFSGALDPKKCEFCDQHTIFYECVFDEDFQPRIACEDCAKESEDDREE
jgi:hypothetical protein